MKAAKTLIPLALFVVAFAGSLSVLRRPVPDAALSAAAASPAAATAALAAAATPAAVSASLFDGVTSRAAGTAPLDAATNARHPGQPGRDPSLVPASASAPVPVALSAQAAPPTGELAESAGPAELQSPSADVSQALDALKYGAPDDRVHAIHSLAATMPSSPELARVRSSLSLVAADEDPDIAARAQEAYDSLMTREDP